MIKYIWEHSWCWAFLAIILTVIVMLIFFRPSPEVITNTRVDTVKTIVHDLKEIQKHDTVTKWYEKPVKEMKQPEKIEVQKIDSIEVVKYYDYDLAVSVEKLANKDLIITVINQYNKVLKVFTYHDVGDIFSITSQVNNIAVKSQFLEWNGLGVYGNHSSSFKWKDHNVEFGAKTGLNYLDKLNLDAKVGYDINLKDFRVTEELTWYLLR